jgi:hypothetical protein
MPTPTPELAAERPQTSLRGFIAAHIDPAAPPDAAVEALLAVIHRRHGDALQAVLAYGSYLRGKRDTVLDFYVLLDDYRSLRAWQRPLAVALAPNVYQIGASFDAADGPRTARAKYAVLTPRRFLRGTRREFHSYFWARFAQPCQLLYCRDAGARAAVLDALEAAPRSFARRVLPTLPARFDSRALWQGGLQRTYRCELRSEKPGQAQALFETNRPHFQALTRLLAAESAGFDAAADSTGDSYSQPQPGAMRRRLAGLDWGLRAALGKLLSVARIAKAATTFEAPLEYLLWKIERHSGIRANPSPRQLRHPLIFAWPLLWRLYRQGAFR